MPKRGKASPKKEPIKYKFVYAWGKYVDSKDYYIQEQMALAEKENAPLDAYARSADGTWHVIGDLIDAGLVLTLREYVNHLP